MTPHPRGRIAYSVGNENDPGNPFGRSKLFIALDGRARHILFTRGGTFAWTGVVAADPLERFWNALARAGFPDCPMIMPPGGSTMRSLTIGDGSEASSIHLPFHAAVPGYDVAFSILDVILREMSEGKVKDAPGVGTPLVADVERAEPPPPPPPPPPEPVVDRPGIGAGAAFLLAYLPAHRLAHEAKLAHLETLADPALTHARMFGGAALKIAASTLTPIDERRAELMRAVTTTMGLGFADGVDVRSELTTPVAKSAWKAGETAGAVLVAAELAAHVAYFRASAPENAALRAQAEEHARVLRESAAQLATDLAATRRILAVRHKDDAARMVSLTGDVFAELQGLASDLGKLFRAMGHHLDDDGRRVFSVIDVAGIVRRRVSGWDELKPRIFDGARPELQPVLERAFGLLRGDAQRVIERRSSGPSSGGAAPGAALAKLEARAKLVEGVRARTMAPEDAYERLAPRAWLDDERRWFVTEKVAKGTKLDEPMLSVAWTSWVLRRAPSSIDVLTTLCADPKNAVLAEDYALEACRLMAIWGWRTPQRVIWLAEERPRFFAYEGARPFRDRANELLRQDFELEALSEERAHGAENDAFEAQLAAKLDLLRSVEWPAELGRNPFEPIVEIWRLGYALSAVLDFGVVLLAPAPKLEELLEPLLD